MSDTSGSHDPTSFRDILAESARIKTARYVHILREYSDPTPDQVERFERVCLRIFTDGVMWSLGALMIGAAENLADLDQLDPVIEVHRALSTILADHGITTTTSGGDRAGQDDPRARS